MLLEMVTPPGVVSHRKVAASRVPGLGVGGGAVELVRPPEQKTFKKKNIFRLEMAT